MVARSCLGEVRAAGGHKHDEGWGMIAVVDTNVFLDVLAPAPE